MRAAPLADDVRPVRPGMPGGRYKPLSEEAVQQIHQSALQALEEIGLSQAPPSGVKLLTEAGAIICPAIPSFYSGADTVEKVCLTVIDRVLDLAGFNVDSFRWGG